MERVEFKEPAKPTYAQQDGETKSLACKRYFFFFIRSSLNICMLYVYVHTSLVNRLWLLIPNARLSYGNEESSESM